MVTLEMASQGNEGWIAVVKRVWRNSPCLSAFVYAIKLFCI